MVKQRIAAGALIVENGRLLLVHHRRAGGVRLLGSSGRRRERGRRVGGTLSTVSTAARAENIVEAAFLSAGEMDGKTVFPTVVAADFWRHLREGFTQPHYLGVREAVIPYAARSDGDAH